uniref:Uncharacterized protein n=1 Tax=Meloidogyne enterolobii TaxID=390850 RepID=A0A6V7UNB7_MELEN|nr:unnamed protein product [Meloidogyne enterolobii]
MATRLEGLNFGLVQVRDLVHNFNESNDKMTKEWHEQQLEHWKRLDEERERLENSIRTMEKEMDQMRDSYQKEIVEGRKWLEEQREVGHIERRAFQEEQTQLLDWIEKAKEQLEVDKAEFLRREHDLLARILNERALLEIEKREFRQQRDADVLRLKEEAEHLEQCLNQAENAKIAMENAKKEFERRSSQLTQLREVLSRYENLATRLVRSTQQKITKEY